MHAILSAVFKAATKEWGDKGIAVGFQRESDPSSNAIERLFINGIKTQVVLRQDIAYDFDYAMKKSGKPLSGEELYNEIYELVNNLIEHEVNPI